MFVRVLTSGATITVLILCAWAARGIVLDAARHLTDRDMR